MMLRLFASRAGRTACLHGVRFASTDVKPPMLAKLREDMKAAMRAKDKPRLNVIKGIIGDMNNQPLPIRDDMGVVSLITKKIAAVNAVEEEYRKADRADLAAQATEELAILKEYEGLVERMSKEELEPYVAQAISTLREGGKKPQAGAVFKLLFGPNGELRDEPVRKQDVKDLLDKLVRA